MDSQVIIVPKSNMKQYKIQDTTNLSQEILASTSRQSQMENAPSANYQSINKFAKAQKRSSMFESQQDQYEKAMLNETDRTVKSSLPTIARSDINIADDSDQVVHYENSVKRKVEVFQMRGVATRKKSTENVRIRGFNQRISIDEDYDESKRTSMVNSRERLNG